MNDGRDTLDMVLLGFSSFLTELAMIFFLTTAGLDEATLFSLS